MRAAGVLLLVLLCACSRQPEQPQPARSAAPAKKLPSPFDDHFWNHWNDGKVEVCRYTVSGGTATMYTYVDARRVMTMNLWKQAPAASEMWNVRLSLEGSDRMPAGSVLSIAISRHTPSGPEWRQATFGPERAFVAVQQAGQPDLQRVLAYTTTPFPLEILMLWARRVAWPRLNAEARRDTHVIRSLEIQERVRLVRTEQGATAGGWTFDVHPALPHHIKAWRAPSGEQAQLTGCERLPASSLDLVVNRSELGRIQALAAE